MNGILWLFSGALVGLAMSLIMRPDASRDIVFNIWVAVVGGTLGGWFLSPLIGAPSVSERGFGIASLFAALLGAFALLVALRFVRRQLTQL